jgi:hypothetical protein
MYSNTASAAAVHHQYPCRGRQLDDLCCMPIFAAADTPSQHAQQQHLALLLLQPQLNAPSATGQHQPCSTLCTIDTYDA